jgi:hypothetical protein
MVALTDTVSILRHLVSSGSLTAVRTEQLVNEYTLDGRVTLGGFLGLVFTARLVTKFIELLPLTVEYIVDGDPFDWPLSGEAQAEALDYESTR